MLGDTIYSILTAIYSKTFFCLANILVCKMESSFSVKMGYHLSTLKMITIGFIMLINCRQPFKKYYIHLGPQSSLFFSVPSSWLHWQSKAIAHELSGGAMTVYVQIIFPHTFQHILRLFCKALKCHNTCQTLHVTIQSNLKLHFSIIGGGDFKNNVLKNNFWHILRLFLSLKMTQNLPNSS